jgi:hypothetical protein
VLAVFSLQENIRRNFGMPQPNGYRKAMRFMRHANKFGLPIVTFVDTPGAYAGKTAEELGQVGASWHMTSWLLNITRLLWVCQLQQYSRQHSVAPELASVDPAGIMQGRLAQRWQCSACHDSCALSATWVC